MIHFCRSASRRIPAKGYGHATGPAHCGRMDKTQTQGWPMYPYVTGDKKQVTCKECIRRLESKVSAVAPYFG